MANPLRECARKGPFYFRFERSQNRQWPTGENVILGIEKTRANKSAGVARIDHELFDVLPKVTGRL